MKVVTGKNLYIAEKAEKKFKRIKLDFDKFLYFRHLETLHSSSFLTVSIFLGLLQDQEMIWNRNFQPISPSTIYSFPYDLCFHETKQKSDKQYVFTCHFGVCPTIDSSQVFAQAKKQF